MRRLAPLVAAASCIAAGCGGDSAVPSIEPAAPAPPQSADVGWMERYGTKEQRLVFAVDRIVVDERSWTIEGGIRNRTDVAYRIGSDSGTLGLNFGVMLFRTGEITELEDRVGSQALPGLRPARTFEPPLPDVLEPGARWSGTFSAPGSLAAGRWLRVVFGELVAEDDPPEGLEQRVNWITDSAYFLRQ